MDEAEIPHGLFDVLAPIKDTVVLEPLGLSVKYSRCDMSIESTQQQLNQRTSETQTMIKHARFADDEIA